MSAVPLAHIVLQHAEEAVMLRDTRAHMLRAPNVGLRQLARMDERLAAHLDGLAVAGEQGARLAAAALQAPGRGECFVAAVRALEDGNAEALAQVFEAAMDSPEARAGTISAFGWVSPASLRGVTQKLSASPSALAREVAVAALAMHRVDSAGAFSTALHDEDANVRRRALRTLSALGRGDLLHACLQMLQDADEACTFDAARAALMLGDRRMAPAALEQCATQPGPWRSQALCLLLMAQAPRQAHELLKALAQAPDGVRQLVAGAGVSGDPHYVPWLIEQMRQPALARLAGESFCTITGLDLSHPVRELPQPEALGEGEDLADEDDGLPWPDADKVGGWWAVHGHRFTPGVRHFMGEPLSGARCAAVLLGGLQRQRRAAAMHLCLIQPGAPLFDTCAPAWRQKRWLQAAGG